MDCLYHLNHNSSMIRMMIPMERIMPLSMMRWISVPKAPQTQKPMIYGKEPKVRR